MGVIQDSVNQLFTEGVRSSFFKSPKTLTRQELKGSLASAVSLNDVAATTLEYLPRLSAEGSVRANNELKNSKDFILMKNEDNTRKSQIGLYYRGKPIDLDSVMSMTKVKALRGVDQGRLFKSIINRLKSGEDNGKH